MDLVLTIGNKNLSSWSLRPWLVLRHAGIPFREQVLLFEDASFRTAIAGLSPSKRVPVLEHRREGLTTPLRIWDSLAICEYLAESFPDAGLWPEDSRARAFARSISAEMHSGFTQMRVDLSMEVVARYEPKRLSETTQTDVARVQAIWAECRATYGAADQGPFLFGRFGIADAMFAPVVYRFRTYGVPVEDAAARAWAEAILALPSMQAWETDAAAEVAAAATPR